MPLPIPSQLEAIEAPITGGLVAWSIVSTICLVHFVYLHVIDKLRKTKHAHLCRSSKTVSALRLVAALAVLTVYVAGSNRQGFVCHEHGGAEPTCAQDGGSWVFPFRFIGYVAAAAATNYVMGLLVWSDTSSRLWLALFGAGLWTLAGVFGTLTGYDYHHWWYFYLGLFNLAALIALFVFTRRRCGFNVTILLDVYLLLHVAALIIWVFSPAGYREEHLGIEASEWFYLVFDLIVYAVIPMFVSIVHIPHRFAVHVSKGRASAYTNSANTAHVSMLQKTYSKSTLDPEYADQVMAGEQSRQETSDIVENAAGYNSNNWENFMKSSLSDDSIFDGK